MQLIESSFPLSTMKRLGFRYSLRTFLAAVTLFAVMMGVWMHRALEQKRKVRSLYGVHLHVKYDMDLRPPTDRFLPVQSWLANLLGKDWVSVPVEAKAKSEAIYPEDLAALVKLRWLRSVDLRGTTTDDDGLGKLAKLQRLESLTLSDTCSGS
jgi:hypothetical protein